MTPNEEIVPVSDERADVRAPGGSSSTSAEPSVTELDLGVQWDYGAPLPHLVANGSDAVLICREFVSDPAWDGTYTISVSANEDLGSALLKFTFTGCYAATIGGPNVDVMSGHPLFSLGLTYFGPHIVHNSPWRNEAERINSVHPQHRPGQSDDLTHYVFVFKDDLVEVLAAGVRVEQVYDTLSNQLHQAVSEMVAR